MKKLGRTAILAVLIVILSALLLMACDDKESPNADYKVIIHPNNGNLPFVWSIIDDIPRLERNGYDYDGLFVDSAFTMQTSFEALKKTGITDNIEVYVKWVLHVHKFSEKWSYDDNYHWRSATCGHDEIEMKGKHSLNNNICSVCGYKTTATVTSKIVFWVDGNKYATKNVVNYMISFPDPPNKSGYSFDGWFFDDNIYQKRVEENKQYYFDKETIDVYAVFSLDIFIDAPELQEFKGYKKELELGSGWRVYAHSGKTSQTANVNSDVGYIECLNAFVVEKEDSLSVQKCNDSTIYFDGGNKGMLFSESLGIRALRVKDGVIVCILNSGDVSVFDYDGKVLIPCGIIGSRDATSDRFSGNATIDSVLSILDGGIIAVNPKFDTNGIEGYISLYSSINNVGYSFCRIKSIEDELANIKCFDREYITVANTDNSVNYIYFVSQKVFEENSTIVPTLNGTVRDNGQENCFSEVTYFGNGKFFVYQDWTVDNSKDYKFFDGYNYYDFKRYIYIPKKDSIEQYTKNKDKVFFNLGNKYYNSDKSGIDTKNILKDEYTFASHGITIINRIGIYDQFVLDDNLNVVISLSKLYDEYHENSATDNNVDNYVSVVLNHVKGVGIDAMKYPETGILYGGNGKFVAHDYKSAVTEISYINDRIIASVENNTDSKNRWYGAFSKKGEVVIPFEYYALSAFRDSYAIGNTKNEDGISTWYIVGSDGKRVSEMSDGSTPLVDMVETSAKAKYIYKIGCYMFKTTEKVEDGKNIYKYGIKNFNPNANKNIIMNATMSAGCTLYMSNSSHRVFVFERVLKDNNIVTYCIYEII